MAPEVILAMDEGQYDGKVILKSIHIMLITFALYYMATHLTLPFLGLICSLIINEWLL